MLQLALAVLLAGSLITGGLDGDKDKDKDKAKANAQQPIESILVPHDDAPVGVAEDDPINDTYALGRTEMIPIKLWIGYSRGSDDEAYAPDGEEVPLSTYGINEVNVQRAFVGAQLNVINFTNFSVGVGGQLVAAQNEASTAAGDLDSGFGLQNIKGYGMIRGRTLGVHGGYLFDLGTEPEDRDADEIGNSDASNAWFVGVDFDYPSDRFRIFAGIDYFNRDELAGQLTNGSIEDDELVVFNAGAGIKFAFVEIGAAALLRTNLAINRLNALGSPLVPLSGGGHQGSIAPYLILSPDAFPVAISVKGAVLSEYADYGYSLGGAADFVTRSGFTVTASLGF